MERAEKAGGGAVKKWAVLLLGRPCPTWGALPPRNFCFHLSGDREGAIVVSYGNKCIVIVCIYNNSPFTAETIPDAAFIFTTRVEPVSAPPAFTRRRKGEDRCWWSRRVLPPGPRRLFHDRFSVIAGKSQPFEYRGGRVFFQGLSEAAARVRKNVTKERQSSSNIFT